MAGDEWKAPEVLAMILCDKIVREEGTGQAYLLGVLSKISCEVFPAFHPGCWVYVALTNGRGAYELCLRLLLAETEQELLRSDGDLDLPDPLQVAELDFALPPLPLPRPGKYRLDFLCNGVLCGSRWFVAEQLEEGGAP